MINLGWESTIYPLGDLLSSHSVRMSQQIHRISLMPFFRPILRNRLQTISLSVARSH